MKFHLFMESADNGCNWYRIRQPYTKLMQKDLMACASNRDLKDMDLDVWMQKSDVVISQAATSEKFLEFMRECRGQKKFVLDIDDNLFNVSPFNPAYRDIGLREVKTGETMLWENGRDGFDLERNRKRMNVAVDVLKECDMITTPSSVLSGIFKRWNKNTRVIKNFVDLNVWKPLKLEKDEFVRIGWQGGHSHYQDFYMIKDVLIKIMEKHQNVKLVLMGSAFDGLLTGLPQDRVEIENWAAVQIYPWKFKTLNIDIGLAPIENNEFNTCKSEVKWEEYGALGIPCVASNIPPYLLAIHHNHTGLLASNAEEWLEYLNMLIMDKKKRLEIGQNAMDKIRKDYDLNTKIEEYVLEYGSLFRPKLIAA